MTNKEVKEDLEKIEAQALRAREQARDLKYMWEEEDEE